MQLQDIRQTEEYARYMEKIGWRTEYIDVKTSKAVVFVKKLPLFPISVMKVLRFPEFLSNTYVVPLKKYYRALVLKQEPLVVDKKDSGAVYFQVSSDNSWPVTPTKSVWVDLTKPEAEILANFKAKTRYNLRKAKQVLDTKIISGDKASDNDLLDFFELWSTSKLFNWLFRASFQEFFSLVKNFNKKCFLIFVYQKENQAKSQPKPVGVCLVLTSDTMAFYWHNVSNKTGKKLFAPTLYVWEAITESKKRGCKVFDFEGVFDERYPKLNQGWKGFTRFKESFCA